MSDQKTTKTPETDRPALTPGHVNVQYRLLMAASGKAALQFGVLCAEGCMPNRQNVGQIIAMLQACDKAMEYGERAFLQAELSGQPLGIAAQVATSAMDQMMRGQAIEKPEEEAPSTEA